MTNRARRLASWLLLPPALFALACALLAPVEAGRAPAAAARSPRRTTQETRGRQKPEPDADSTVRGRVVYDDTSRPARRARVILMGEGDAGQEYDALTDARGEFRIKGVRAGSYFAFADVPGVLSPIAFVSVGELRGGSGYTPDFGEARAFFDVFEVDGKEDAEVTIHARRGASIAGLVTYADGDPAVNVTVNLMRRDAAGRLQQFLTGANLVALSGLRTDDRGMFRLTGLPPGEYVVGVSEAVDHSPDGTRRRRADDVPAMVDAMAGQQLLTTFYPSVLSAKEAAVVKVAAGEERAGVDIRIPERGLRNVSGVVRSRRGGLPLARAQVSISRSDDPPGASALSAVYDAGQATADATMTDEEGRWQFTEIPDGAYTITVKPAEEYEPGSSTAYDRNANVSVTSVETSSVNMNGDYRPPRRKRGYAPARRDVKVSGGDLSDVLIEAGEGGRVSGRMTVEGEGSISYAHVRLLRVADGGGQPAADDARDADVNGGRFSFEGLPAGRFFFQPRTYAEAGTLYVKSVTWNGKDLTREPLALAEGASAEGVQIVFAHNPATLRLTAVRAADRKPAPYAFAFLVPVDASAWSPYSARQLSCSTGDGGSCVVKAPPGEYRVVVLPRKLVRESVEAEVGRRAPDAPRVVLRAGETKEFAAVVADR